MTDSHILETLYQVIESRKGADPESSYTAKLFAKGRKKIAQKIGEEGVELAIAATSEGRAEVVSESADLLYHMLALWASAGIPPHEVWEALEKRLGTSGIEEKKARGSAKKKG